MKEISQEQIDAVIQRYRKMSSLQVQIVDHISAAVEDCFPAFELWEGKKVNRKLLHDLRDRFRDPTSKSQKYISKLLPDNKTLDLVTPEWESLSPGYTIILRSALINVLDEDTSPQYTFFRADIQNQIKHTLMMYPQDNTGGGVLITESVIKRVLNDVEGFKTVCQYSMLVNELNNPDQIQSAILKRLEFAKAFSVYKNGTNTFSERLIQHLEKLQ